MRRRLRDLEREFGPLGIKIGINPGGHDYLALPSGRKISGTAIAQTPDGQALMRMIGILVAIIFGMMAWFARALIHRPPPRYTS
jgi:hypothetical protein